MPRDETKRRGSYTSGEDYVLEYGELRFYFNEHDFRQRIEQAAVKLEFIEAGLGDDELEDLVNLAINGEIREPQSALGEHVNERWQELVGPSECFVASTAKSASCLRASPRIFAASFLASSWLRVMLGFAR